MVDSREKFKMLVLLKRLRAELALVHAQDTAQDLVEYALVAVIIALAATAGMGSVAKEINNVFSSVATKIAAYGS